MSWHVGWKYEFYDAKGREGGGGICEGFSMNTLRKKNWSAK